MSNSPSQQVANAIRQGNLNTIKTIAGTNRLPSSALDMAITERKTAIVEFLLKSGVRSKNAVTIAVSNYTPDDILDLLVKYKYSFRTPIRPDGTRPLHISPYAHVTKYLLNAGVSPNTRNDDGWTPLMYNAYKANEKTVELLLQQPTVNVNARGKAANVGRHSFVDKTTALHLTLIDDRFIHLRKRVLQFLINAGANVNALDANNRTPLISFAVELSKTSTFMNFHITMIDMLIDAGTIVTKVDVFDKTAFWYLAPRIRQSSLLNKKQQDDLLHRIAWGSKREAFLPDNLNLHDPVTKEKVNLNNAYFIWTDVISRRRVDKKGRQPKQHVRAVYNKSTLDELMGRYNTRRSPMTKKNLVPRDIIKVTVGVPKREITRFKAMLANSNKNKNKNENQNKNENKNKNKNKNKNENKNKKKNNSR